jgi:very-short-patch-repair endonuclease
MEQDQKPLVQARRMRRAPTDAEARLWCRLRAGRMLAYKFRRQQPIGRFVVDFACMRCKLVIELDGGQHLDRLDQDLQRTGWLRSQGFEVIRFWNDDVLVRTDVVLEEILRVLEGYGSR